MATGDTLGLPERYAALREALGDVLEVRGYDLEGSEGDVIRRHVADLDRFPKPLLARLAKEGLRRVAIGPGSVADFAGYEHWANVQAPGYPPGVTWADIGGGYDYRGNALVAGTQGLRVDHIVVHEMGHALGHLLGYYEDFRLIRAYREDLPRLHAFFKGEGRPSERGLQEYFAVAVERAILYPKMDKFAVDALHDFIYDIVLRGRNPRSR